jgi:hypothetical protein
MSRRARIAAGLCVTALVSVLMSASASAEPILGLQLAHGPEPAVPVTHSDERLAYDVTVQNTASVNAAVGTELTCPSSATGNPAPTVERQWLRDGAPIPSANASTYTVVPADEGHSLQCKVTATNDADGAGSLFAPITAVAISRPPVAVEPLPSPAPPSGTSEPVMQGPAAAAPKGTATTVEGSNVLTNVITVKGSGDLEAGSKVIKNVVTTTGVFIAAAINRQTIVGPGLPEDTRIDGVDPFNKTITLSKAAGETKAAAALAAGALPFQLQHEVSGPGIPAGAKITSAVGNDGDPPLQFTISAPATASATGVEVVGIAKKTCSTPAGWTPAAGITWSFQWLRNGQPIPGATNSTYVVQESDVEPPSILQCLATAEDVAGHKALSISSIETTRPAIPAPYSRPIAQAGPVSFDNKTEGEIDVEVQMPPGTQLLRLAGEDWECAKFTPTEIQPATGKCTRSDSLAPGGSYPPIALVAQVAADAPDALLTKVSASGGGAVNSPTAEDEVTGILPAVPFGFKAFEIEVLDEFGKDFSQAGGHPHLIEATVEFTEHVRPVPTAEADFRAANGFARNVRTEAPPGFIGNPEVVEEKCANISEVVTRPSTCPASSVVGGIRLRASVGQGFEQPIYAIEPEFGTPAQFAFGVAAIGQGFAYTLTPELRPEDGYAVTLVTAPIQKAPELFDVEAILCNRGAETLINVDGETRFAGCRGSADPEATEEPFLTLPTRCGHPASTLTRIFADTWDDPGNYVEAAFSAPDLTGCEGLGFAPTLKARPTTTAADSPTGLEVDLHIPQNQDPEGTATATLRKSVVTLPEGLVVNPAGANGLDACSPSQIDLGTNNRPSCPDASKIGSIMVQSPLLDHPLPGSVYVATPHENPFGSLLALYLVIDDPRAGIVIKLPGRVEADPQTGRLTSTFDENPELPFEDLELKLRAGATAPLRTPSTCGNFATTSELTPWSAPDSGPPATPSDPYQISQGAGGGTCAFSPAALPHAPDFEAGTASPLAGAYSPFVLRLRREDGSQELSAITVTPPPGLVGKLAGIPQCPDSSLAAAAAKSGRAEQASPSCPAASQVGSVTAGAGAGPAPYYASGKAYLAGPYKGAPVSLAVVTPAVAGPFDIGTVVVRAAIYVDPVTAQITAKADPLPRILEGIPLDVRTVVIAMDRPDFTLNPTSCDPMAITGEAVSTLGQVAGLNNRFQVGECGALGFKPNLKINLKGKTTRGAYQRLSATVTYPKGPGYANIASAAVTFPHSIFLAQNHIRTICTRVQFAADQCPPGSIYGQATAITPLIDAPLTGPVYLRSSSNPLPDVVVALRGPASLPIEVELAGRVDSKNRGIRTTFDFVPDAPVSKFTLQMRGGAKSLFVNSRNLCKGEPQRATVRMTAQNGKRRDFRPVIGNDCRKKGGGKKQSGKQRNAR